MIDTDHNQNQGDPSQAQEAMRQRAKILERDLAAAQNEAQMPRYQCHKKVWALKIAEVKSADEGIQPLDQEYSGDRILVFAEEGYEPLRVDHAYASKHKPVAGGYYVVYDDGYKSFSPAKAFEDGYTLIP